jgi:hypothetical protein
MRVLAALLAACATLCGAEEAGFDVDRFRPVRTVAVANVREFEAALARAEPGDLIDVAPGVYETTRAFSIARGGSAERPVVIRSRQAGGARIRGAGAFQATGVSYVAIDGFDIAHQDGAVRDGRFFAAHALIARGCRHLRFTRNLVHVSETREEKPQARRSHWIEITGEDSHHNRVDRNRVEEKRNGGVMVVLGGSGAATGYRMSRYDRVDHNHFRNFYRGSGNGFETIRVGSSPYSHTAGDTEIDDNLFEDCDGEAEIISVKCHGVAVRRNTFLNSRGMLTYRNGNSGVAEGNWFLNPSGKRGVEGIRFYGTGHRVVHNFFEGLTGAAILIRTGDVEQRRGGWHDMTPKEYGNYLRPEKALVAFNTMVRCAVGISIGDRRAEYSLPPRQITIADNLLIASPIEEQSKPLDFTWRNNTTRAGGDDRRAEDPVRRPPLTAAAVGPDAPRQDHPTAR